MSKGIFTDKKRKPTAKAIETAIGRAGRNWKELNEFLVSSQKLKGELKFYGVNYGWAMRFTKSGKSIVALYPDEDSFTVQIILKNAQLEAAYARGVSDSTKEAANGAAEFNEGRWVFIHVDAKSGIDDAVTLVNARLGVR